MQVRGKPAGAVDFGMIAITRVTRQTVLDEVFQQAQRLLGAAFQSETGWTERSRCQPAVRSASGERDCNLDGGIQENFACGFSEATRNSGKRDCNFGRMMKAEYCSFSSRPREQSRRHPPSTTEPSASGQTFFASARLGGWGFHHRSRVQALPLRRISEGYRRESGAGRIRCLAFREPQQCRGCLARGRHSDASLRVQTDVARRKRRPACAECWLPAPPDREPGSGFRVARVASSRRRMPLPDRAGRLAAPSLADFWSVQGEHSFFHSRIIL